MSKEAYLSEKVAIISGAAGGVGRATSRLLAESGARVMLADLATAALESFTASLRDEGFDVACQVVDIADEASVKALFEATLRRFGRLDILDNNAASQGQAEDREVATMSVELWDHIMGVNARGAMLMCKHAIPAMIASGGGSIINISSGTSLAGDVFATAYACSKGAVNTLTKYVATQYGSQGIRCNALTLGLVETPPLVANIPPPLLEVFTAHKLVGRIGQPRDVAEMVAFLASDRSAWITGQVFSVDGGFYAHTPSTVGVAQLMTQMATAK
jgi:NAD(P)-dependent dehydrogenase (short-subunit alcohol dehydrogenase family)